MVAFDLSKFILDPLVDNNLQIKMQGDIMEPVDVIVQHRTFALK